MSFGLTAAEDVFEHKLDTIFNYLDFCTGIADDMIIWSEETDVSDCDKPLTTFL